MAAVKSYVRLWPLLVAAIGVAGLVYAGVKWTRPAAPPDADPDIEPGPVTDPGPDEHYEKVRPHLLDEYSTYKGEVHAESPVDVRVPAGMIVPVVKVHHELGDFVKKGDVLITFAKNQVDDAIEKAHAEGRTDDEKRFRSYLPYVELKAPVDGVVLKIWRTEGETPVDVGISVVQLADKSAYRFVVLVPADVQRSAMILGTRFPIDFEELGTVNGTVAEFGEAAGPDVPVVLTLDPHEGYVERMEGTMRVVSGHKEAGLIPKTAVVRKSDVPIVRVWDPDSHSINDRTVKLGDEKGADVVVLAGVYVGDSVVVPGRARQ